VKKAQFSMDFTALRYFQETARCGSIRKASEALHISASSISRCISALEHDLGAPLFERNQKGMKLTAAGNILAWRTSHLFRDLERIRGEIDDLQGLRRGKVSLYTIEGFIASFLPTLISDFRMQYPNVLFEVMSASTDAVVEAIVDDVADIGITFNGPIRSDIVTIFEYSEPLCCLVSASHPMAALSEITMSELITFPFALPEISYGLRRMVDGALAAAKLRPQLALNTNSLELAKRLAITGDAIAFMPSFMARDEVAAGSLRLIRVASPLFDGARVSVCVHRDRKLSFASKAFLSSLTEQMQSLKAELCAKIGDA